MEHPILFISLILQALGLPVPHTPVGQTLLEKLCEPYMTYTWMVMAFLIIVPKLTMGKMEMVPGSGQNFWEVMIGGLMDFFAENLGEKSQNAVSHDGNFLFLYYSCQFNWAYPRLHVTHFKSQHYSGNDHYCLGDPSCVGIQVPWAQLLQTLHGAESGVGALYVFVGTDQ